MRFVTWDFTSIYVEGSLTAAAREYGRIILR
jgi:hypothetical protein